MRQPLTPHLEPRTRETIFHLFMAFVKIFSGKIEKKMSKNGKMILYGIKIALYFL
jgi:hypothetical protein